MAALLRLAWLGGCSLGSGFDAAMACSGRVAASAQPGGGGPRESTLSRFPYIRWDKRVCGTFLTVSHFALYSVEPVVRLVMKEAYFPSLLGFCLPRDLLCRLLIAQHSWRHGHFVCCMHFSGWRWAFLLPMFSPGKARKRDLQPPERHA